MVNKSNNPSQTNAWVAHGVGFFSISKICKYCQVKGHVKVECWKLKKKNGKKPNEDPSANIANNVFDDDTYCTLGSQFWGYGFYDLFMIDALLRSLGETRNRVDFAIESMIDWFRVCNKVEILVMH